MSWKGSSKVAARGIGYERRIAAKAREEGKIAIRSGGSQGPIDLCIIDPVMRQIRLLQCKKYKDPKVFAKLKEDLERKWHFLAGQYVLTFEVV